MMNFPSPSGIRVGSKTERSEARTQNQLNSSSAPRQLGTLAGPPPLHALVPSLQKGDNDSAPRIAGMVVPQGCRDSVAQQGLIPKQMGPLTAQEAGSLKSGLVPSCQAQREIVPTSVLPASIPEAGGSASIII